MGEVYLSRDTQLERPVALKILPAEMASDAERMRRFTQQAKSTAALNHPSIAHIYEIGESNGTHSIAMEYVDGVILRQKIHREKGPLPKLLRYLQQSAEALAKAHAAGIVHRDFKPDNIMVARDGAPRFSISNWPNSWTAMNLTLLRVMIQVNSGRQGFRSILRRV